jgi:Lrp/AsnC family transcriptional regulator, regulator for asnA, asnC and gidA
MLTKVDQIDRAIINYLKRDGRIRSVDIARELNLADRTVRYRINRLIERDLISVTAVLHPVDLGYHVLGDIVCAVDTGKVNEVADEIARFPEVGYVACGTGDQDISLQAYFASTDDLYAFVTGKLAHVPGVLKTRTTILLRVVKSIWQWEVPEANVEQTNQGSEEERR